MFTFIPITHPTSDTKHPLLLLQSAHGEKYFFGKISEGSQRSLTENKIRISKLKDIFLTGELNWSDIGGLPGMILTIADQGKSNLILHYGNDILNYIVSTWRYFVFRFGIDLNDHIMKDKEVYRDNAITVKCFNVFKNGESGTGEIFNSFQKTLLGSIVSKMFPKHAPTDRYDPSSDPHLNVELPGLDAKVEVSTNYEICFNPVRGKFKLDEALKLGVPKGPLFAKLTKGQKVTLDDGTVVTPEEVLEKERHFAKVLILDIPDDLYLNAFVEKFKAYDCTDLGVVYYFLGDAVTINDNLFKFIDTFHENNCGKVNHMVSHNKISPNTISFFGSALTTLKLKALQVNNYNLPRTDRVFSKDFYETFDKPLSKGTSMSESQETPLNTIIEKDNIYIFAQNKRLTLEPFHRDEEPMKCEINGNITPLSWQQVFEEHIKPLEFPLADVDTVINDQLHVNNFNNTVEKKKHVEIITLGTGSALPSKYRNVVSTLVKVPYIRANGDTVNRNILLDAGENTLGTLHRMFSQPTIQLIFQNLKMIYLSHLHADHHLGIVSILNEWYKYNKDDETSYIYVITPWQYNKFISEWLVLENKEIMKKIKYISCEHFINDSFVRMQTQSVSSEEFNNILQENSDCEEKRKLDLDKASSYRDVELITQMYEDLSIEYFQTCRAIHCSWAYSNSITFQMDELNEHNKFKVSYSGDTRPNIEKFSYEIGYGSDLLIHEATLENQLIDDAIKKKHCTINEAIDVSNEMNARKLILTHFSQRYPKLPQLDNNIDVKAKEFCFAFDSMIVDYEKIGEQQHIFPLLNKAFIEEREQEDESEDSENTPSLEIKLKKQKRD
ncbi:trz1p [Saccharomyces arboricola H-6]|uniref:ribonuclease Z n=1 Tax=Saccharomyces arboricola (strain H-6 / AS 2.3317 / CBS 10644) TaxID=1160507 RepID=J8Q5H1_SACAR|nr:trz1p [Saccharomyces arboricola H-6]